ncbi:Puf3p [Saccharomyces cerevisiae x Saccharomyces kudriavzevii VIN7]|uniref:Pumilio homology domain family member 3 n=1 Tax=Saccharomyces cerevisiae x Saccharomyces kudriavzevii (strain VIN7) TaxID=1095631 RepID=H0GXY7_SACCK|nr:Puf3p [Saccharomyces cerevisiae x Saccharomyces kudriavzevii VIN7]
MEMDMDMDMELASIVSSLSALSNGNNNGRGQTAAVVGGATAGSQQIGGFRRSSFTTSNDVDSDILLLHGSSESSPIFKKTALSVGTAPPFSTNSRKFFGGSGNYYQYRSNDTASLSSASYNNYHTHNAAGNLGKNNKVNHLLGQYSASIAGPVYYNGNDNSNAGGEGFFEKFGKSLIDGTRELESQDRPEIIANQSQFITKTVSNASLDTQSTFEQPAQSDTNANRLNRNATNSGSLYHSSSNSGSSASLESENAHYPQRNIWNVANTPVFRPSNNPATVGAPNVSAPSQSDALANNFPPYMNGFPPNQFHQGSHYQNFPNYLIGSPSNFISQMISVQMPTNEDAEDSDDKKKKKKANRPSSTSSPSSPPNNASFPFPYPNPMMFMPPAPPSAPQQQEHHQQQENPYIYYPSPTPASAKGSNKEEKNFEKRNNKNHPANNSNNTSKQANPYLETFSNTKNSSKKNTSSKSGEPASNNHKSQSHSHSQTPPQQQQQQQTYHRSPLLEQLRNSSSDKNSSLNMSLKDIFGHSLEFCKDQHGSRFIQRELATSPASEKEVIFNEIRDDAIELSNDVFGNYVIQKFFEFGSKIQKDALVEQFKGHMKELSLQMYACRVIQKALEYIDSKQRIKLVLELSDTVLQMIKDQNGNHVIQKAIETIPLEKLPFVLSSLTGHIYHLSTHSYGCRVIQRLLEFGSSEDERNILNELKDFIPYLIQDQYGNYVIQYILQQDQFTNKEMVDVKQEIIETVASNVVEYSKHKFASNVVEKSILYGSKDQKDLIMSKILPRDKNHALNLEDDSPMILMIKDQFANYVIQKLVNVSEGEGKKLIVIAIRAYLDKLNKSNSLGNRHLASVEKLAALVENAEV